MVIVRPSLFGAENQADDVAKLHVKVAIGCWVPCCHHLFPWASSTDSGATMTEPSRGQEPSHAANLNLKTASVAYPVSVLETMRALSW